MQRETGLREKYWTILSFTGFNLILVSTLMLVPLFALFGWPEEWGDAIGFFLPALGSAGIGMVMWRFFEPRKKRILTVMDGGIIVFLTWALISLFSAIPFMIIANMTFTQSVFEAVSGWTTTGLTMVTDVENYSHMLLLWRSTMQLGGGAGFAIMMLAAITGPVGLGFTEAEGRTEQLAPHVRESAKLVVKLYLGYVVLGILAYTLVAWKFNGGVGSSNQFTFFDSVNHTFTAVATGGFSTKNASIGHWSGLPFSLGIETVTLMLMFLGNLNFLTAYWLFRGKLKSFFRNGEIRLFFAAISISSVVLFFKVTSPISTSHEMAFRTGLFEAVSALTGTGFTITKYGDWSGLGWLIMIILMIIGGGICSTSGGLKQYRVHLLFKSIIWQIKRPFRPRSAIIHNYIWKDDQKEFISDTHIKHTANYVFLYFLTFLAGGMVISAYGHGMKESLFEFASALGTVGLSTGNITLPDAPLPLLWTEILGMFLGRLEFFVVFVSIGKIFRDTFLR